LYRRTTSKRRFLTRSRGRRTTWRFPGKLVVRPWPSCGRSQLTREMSSWKRTSAPTSTTSERGSRRSGPTSWRSSASARARRPLVALRLGRYAVLTRRIRRPSCQRS
jgi:hypothetical protein